MILDGKDKINFAFREKNVSVAGRKSGKERRPFKGGALS